MTVWMAFAMLAQHMQNGLIPDQVISLCEVHKYDPVMQLQTYMEIDSQAIQHLELLEV